MPNIPAGTKLDDGQATRLTFATDPDVSIWEKAVQPPSLSGGGAIETTTFLNTVYRTRAPKSLLSLEDMSFTAAYAPSVYNDMIAMMNVNQLITITFSDASSLAFYGFVDEFAPQEVAEGEQPEAECTVIPTLQNAGVETAPVFTP